ncbi:unnamed protein product [Eruca vesicaria subsp. sativa]|uniref:Ribosomal protein L20 n=1 Tax=Eruca vesicaria subsp. sativa TaxID=29727 RepID=A0ABC8KEX5_ERUVS|nr:unnamed protein product [Eruca vesicaria subsp. sativa]
MTSLKSHYRKKIVAPLRNRKSVNSFHLTEEAYAKQKSVEAEENAENMLLMKLIGIRRLTATRLGFVLSIHKKGTRAKRGRSQYCGVDLRTNGFSSLPPLFLPVCLTSLLQYVAIRRFYAQSLTPLKNCISSEN